MRVIAPFKARDSTMLSIHVEDVIEVLEKRDDGWWKGRLRGEIGFFPVNYCKSVKSPKLKVEAVEPYIRFMQSKCGFLSNEQKQQMKGAAMNNCLHLLEQIPKRETAEKIVELQKQMKKMRGFPQRSVGSPSVTEVQQTNPGESPIGAVIDETYLTLW